MGQIFSDDSEFKKYVNKTEPKKATNKPKATPKSTPEPPKEVPGSDATSNNNVISLPSTNPTSKYTLDFSGVELINEKISPDKIAEQAVKPVVKKDPPSVEEQVAQPQEAYEVEDTEVEVKPESKLKAFLFDHLRTLLNATAIFLVLYLLLNFSAYREIAINLYYDYSGTERQTALTVFSEELSTLQDELLSNPEEAITIITTDDQQEIIVPTSNGNQLPNFDMEVTPPGTRVIIPRLAKNVPIVSVDEGNLLRKDWGALENDLQRALRDGVVHYPGTPWPGQSGNVVLTGHSSYYPWDPGRFKDVFAILHNVKIDDEVIVFHNQQKFIYKVSELKEVQPQQVEVLGDTGDNRLTMLTCTPIGTNLRRLIVTAVPVES